MKKLMTFEIPCGPGGEIDVKVSLAIGKITEYGTRELKEAGVDLVRVRWSAYFEKEENPFDDGT